LTIHAWEINYLRNNTSVIFHHDFKSPNLLVDKNLVVKVFIEFNLMTNFCSAIVHDDYTIWTVHVYGITFLLLNRYAISAYLKWSTIHFFFCRSTAWTLSYHNFYFYQSIHSLYRPYWMFMLLHIIQQYMFKDFCFYKYHISQHKHSQVITHHRRSNSIITFHQTLFPFLQQWPIFPPPTHSH
jgi:hypothetical protein